MNNSRRKNRTIFFLVLSIFTITASLVSAAIIETGDNIQFTPLHRIEDDVYAFGGKNIVMDGFIDGDFTIFSYGVSVNGELTGNGNFFCKEMDHNGKIERSLHAFVESAKINGVVGRSAIAFCSDFVLGGNGSIERDLYGFGGQVDIGGTVKGNAKIHAGMVRVYGVIEGNLEIEADEITISSPAVIKGDLIYHSTKEARIDTSGGVVILGQTEWFPPDESEDDGSGLFRNVVVTGSELLAAFLFGLLILIPFRRYAREAVEQLSRKFVVSLAAGLITMVVFIFAIMVACVSAITFLIGYGLISGDAPAAGALVLIMSTIIFPISAFSAVSGGILFYIGKIILAFMVGCVIYKALKKETAALTKFQLFLGLVALAFVFEIPYLGFLIYLIGSLTGAGAIVLAVRKIGLEISRPKSSEASPQTLQ
jgi:cytoskeletal protein CcmA (bactofilin family)